MKRLLPLVTHSLTLIWNLLGLSLWIVWTAPVEKHGMEEDVYPWLDILYLQAKKILGTGFHNLAILK